MEATAPCVEFAFFLAEVLAKQEFPVLITNQLLPGRESLVGGLGVPTNLVQSRGIVFVVAALLPGAPPPRTAVFIPSGTSSSPTPITPAASEIRVVVLATPPSLLWGAPGASLPLGRSSEFAPSSVRFNFRISLGFCRVLFESLLAIISRF